MRRAMRAAARRARIRSGGFSLMEMMLALTVLAIGTVAAAELFQRSQVGAADGDNVLIAVSLAQLRLEELRNVAYASLASEAEAQISSPSGYSRFCREVAVTTPQTNLRQIDVTISWGPPDCLTSTTNANVVLRTYRSNI